ncbi:hypothetical protein FRC11_013816 [Ceratobasidium sp. 423]|nr:hypothetical protein FRC11_013816 [Ceratobasidium sp. 423]
MIATPKDKGKGPARRPWHPYWCAYQLKIISQLVGGDDNEQRDRTATRQVPGLSNGSCSNCLKPPCPARRPQPFPHWRDYSPIPASLSLGPSPGLQAPAVPIVFYESSPPPEPLAPMASLAFYKSLPPPEPVPFDLIPRPHNRIFGNSQSFPRKSILEPCMPSPVASPGIEEDIIIISSDEELSSAEGDTPTQYQLGRH